MLEFGYRFEEMYEMTVSELLDILEARRKALGYHLWKGAYLTAWAVMGKNFPKTPEKASPELYRKRKTIQMPDNLLQKEMEKWGKVRYE